MFQENLEIEIIVEYDEFLAGRELAEIFDVLDSALFYEISEGYFPHPLLPPYFFPELPQESRPAFFCVKEVNRGSISIGGLVGGAAAIYCYNRFLKGFRPKRFGKSIEQLGKILGDNLDEVLKRINEWLQEYLTEANNRGSRIKNIQARKKALGNSTELDSVLKSKSFDNAKEKQEFKTDKDSRGHIYATVGNVRITYIPAKDRSESNNWADSDVVRIQAYKGDADDSLHRGAEFPIASPEDFENFLVAISQVYNEGRKML